MSRTEAAPAVHAPVIPLQKLGRKTKVVRDVIREVAGYAPYEKRVMELLKVGKDKRALRVCKSRVRPPSNHCLCEVLVRTAKFLSACVLRSNAVILDRLSVVLSVPLSFDSFSECRSDVLVWLRLASRHFYVFGYEYYGDSARLSYVVRQRRVPRAVPLRMRFPGAVCNGTGERARSHAGWCAVYSLARTSVA